MSEFGWFSASAIVLLWFQSTFVLHAPAVAADRISDRHHLGTPGDVFRGRALAFDGKVDIFLDLACPDSATAWMSIKQLVLEYESRKEIVLHVVPMPQNQMALDTAKAVQAVQLYSTDSDEVVLFMDAMFGYQPLILDDADDDVARLGFRGILAKWAVASGTITGDQFESAMELSEIDDLVQYETIAAASLGVHTTPTALLNGNFMVRLVGSKQLNNFRLFFSIVMESQPTEDETDGTSVWELVEGRWIAGEDDIDYSISDAGAPDGRVKA